MNGNDAILEKEAQVTGVKTSGTVSEAAAGAAKPRSTRVLREQEAHALREELGKGLSPCAIRARHDWSTATYYRRMDMVEKMVREEYDPGRAFRIFSRQEALYRRIQRKAEAQVRKIAECLSQTPVGGDETQLRAEASLTNSLVRLLRLIGECETRVLKCASGLGIVPAKQASDGEVRWTFAEFARAATVEQDEQARQRGSNDEK